MAATKNNRMAANTKLVKTENNTNQTGCVVCTPNPASSTRSASKACTTAIAPIMSHLEANQAKPDDGIDGGSRNDMMTLMSRTPTYSPNDKKYGANPLP